MTLPNFWRRAAFSVAESADILDVPIDTLRTWMAREPSGDYLGAKTGNRVHLSGNDVFFYALVRDLTAYGCPTRAAMAAAAGIAELATDELPPEKPIIIRRRARSTEFVDSDDAKHSVAVIPPRALAEEIIERCAAVYKTEAS